MYLEQHRQAMLQLHLSYLNMLNSVFRLYETSNTWIEYLMPTLDTFHLINNLRKATCNYVINLCWLGTVHRMSSFLLAQNWYVCVDYYNITQRIYIRFSFALICICSNTSEVILKYNDNITCYRFATRHKIMWEQCGPLCDVLYILQPRLLSYVKFV